MKWFFRVRQVIGQRKYGLISMVVALLFLWLFVFLPIWLVPGNDFAFFVSMTLWWHWLLLVVLALCTGLLVSLQWFVFDKTKHISVRASSSTLASAMTSFVAGLFVTATCASCISTLFAFLGVSSIFFLIQYQWYLVGFSLLLTFAALVFTIRRVNTDCKRCRV